MNVPQRRSWRHSRIEPLNIQSFQVHMHTSKASILNRTKIIKLKMKRPKCFS